MSQDQYNYPLPTPRLGLREATRNLGLYNPYLDAGKSKNSVVVALMWMGFVMVGMMVAGLMIFNVGIVGAIVGAVSAIIPAGFYLTLFLWLDRYDPEPPGRLIFAFAWGAIIAIFIAYIVNSLFGHIFGGTLAAIISAPIIEEGAKGGLLIIIALYYRKDFDSVVDGIVYAGVVALGFATVENIIYYGESMNSGGTGGLFRTLILRGVIAPYSHVMFTCMTGVGVGIARETHDKALRIAAPIIGYCIAVFLHALWNSLAVLGGAKLFFLGYLLVEAPMFCAFIGLTLYLVHREGLILKQSLAVEVKRGLITQRQLDIAISVFRRTGWVASAVGDGQLFGARRRFLRSVAKLGLCHWHVQRAAEAGSETASFPLITQIQAEVFSLRDKVGT